MNLKDENEAGAPRKRARLRHLHQPKAHVLHPVVAAVLRRHEVHEHVHTVAHAEHIGQLMPLRLVQKELHIEPVAHVVQQRGQELKHADEQLKVAFP